jgi:hypothetical protein
VVTKVEIHFAYVIQQYLIIGDDEINLNGKKKNEPSRILGPILRLRGFLVSILPRGDCGATSDN